MKRTREWAGALLAAVALLLAPAAAPGAERPGFETYVVRHGDTLSGIAKRVFGDAKRWREILKENPQVTNANMIFPGDALLVPFPLTAAPAGAGGAAGGLEAREGTAADAQAAADAAARAAADAAAAAADAARAAAAQAAADAAAAAAVPELPIEKVRPAALVNPILYRSAGSISEGLPGLAIIASLDDRIMLASGDVAIVNAPVVPGERYTVVRADRRIFHPKTGRSLGWLIRVLGSAESTCRGEQTATVALSGMRDAAGVGDYLVPFDPADVLEENVLAAKARPDCVPAGPEDGVIVAFDEDRLMAGEQEFAYLDRGTAAGVAPGKRFTIYRDYVPEGRVMIGELQVLRAGAETSAALITTSVQEIQVGDLLRAR